MLRFLLPPEMGKRMIVSCAACRLQRKKCSEECILAPYFPPHDPDKFIVVQKVFGANYVIKLLQGLETMQRADAVSNLVLEASARVKDPIHGSAGVIQELQKRISDIESQLEVKQKDLTNMQSKFDMLVFPMYTGSPDVQDVLCHTGSTEDTVYEELSTVLWEPM